MGQASAMVRMSSRIWWARAAWLRLMEASSRRDTLELWPCGHSRGDKKEFTVGEGLRAEVADAALPHHVDVDAHALLGGEHLAAGGALHVALVGVYGFTWFLRRCLSENTCWHSPHEWAVFF